MVRQHILLLCLFVIPFQLSCSKGQRIPDAFVGTWQSDDVLTLASVHASDSVTEDEMTILSDDFFGNKIIVFAAREGRAYWVGEEWEGVEQEEQWSGYDIVESGPNFMTLSLPANEYAEAEVITWRVDGDLIYVEDPRGFREYFRRIR